jgi:GWxTD domain-containing protein
MLMRMIFLPIFNRIPEVHPTFNCEEIREAVMNKLYILLIIAVLMIGAGSDARAQDDELFPDMVGVPNFYLDAISLASPDPGMSRLDIYAEVPYSALHFYKLDETFRSNYELTFSVSDSAELLLDEKWVSESLEAENYSESVSAHLSNLTQRSFSLHPGSYIVEVRLKDNETQKITHQKRRVIVRDYSVSRFNLSDIMLVNRIGKDSVKVTIFPNISGIVSNERDTLSLFCEAYGSGAIDSVRFILSVRTLGGTIMVNDTTVQQFRTMRKAIFPVINTNHLVAGDYLIQIRAISYTISDGSNVHDTIVSSVKPFSIRMKGLPFSISDLKKAIDQLQYIINRDSLEAMRAVPSDRQRDLFMNFWKKKDPTPNTERNELMEEYYSRVEYANKHFGRFTEGWKSDMGMVYIIFGVPSNIDSQPFPIDSKPREVWTYYELNQQFVFIDLTGFGDYRLQNSLWDLYRARSR